MKGLRVTGGSVFPTDPPSVDSPDGELIAGASGAGGAFLAFYSDAAKAKRLEPAVTQNAKHFGGQVERHGDVTVLWIRPPLSGLRQAVEGCAFR